MTGPRIYDIVPTRSRSHDHSCHPATGQLRCGFFKISKIRYRKKQGTFTKPTDDRIETTRCRSENRSKGRWRFVARAIIDGPFVTGTLPPARRRHFPTVIKERLEKVRDEEEPESDELGAVELAKGPTPFISGEYEELDCEMTIFENGYDPDNCRHGFSDWLSKSALSNRDVEESGD